MEVGWVMNAHLNERQKVNAVKWFRELLGGVSFSRERSELDGMWLGENKKAFYRIFREVALLAIQRGVDTRFDLHPSTARMRLARLEEAGILIRLRDRGGRKLYQVAPDYEHEAQAAHARWLERQGAI